MKRLGSSDSLGALMSICPSADESSPRNTHVYSREYQSMLDGLDEEGCIEESGHISEKKRRLSVDQVKALEKNFEVENKLEPERKVKLAQELGLQPRQVAVWFQNRRARWKTKQLERDYGVLKANYDNLKLNYESLQRDNETLLKEIREIKAKLNEEENNLSIKEETMATDSENKAVEDSETHVAVTASDAGKDMDYTAKFNDDNGRDTVLIFPNMKDGSSDDSDSSAILNSNEENNSPNAAISSSGIVLQNNNHHHHFIMSSQQQQPPTTSSVNCFQFSDSGTVLNNTQKGYHHHHHHQQQQQQQQQSSQTQFVKLEEHNFFSGEEACNFFSDEQAPTLHWYCPDQWN